MRRGGEKQGRHSLGGPAPHFLPAIPEALLDNEEAKAKIPTDMREKLQAYTGQMNTYEGTLVQQTCPTCRAKKCFKKKGETERRLKLQMPHVEAFRDLIASLVLTGGQVKPGRAPAGAPERY